MGLTPGQKKHMDLNNDNVINDDDFNIRNKGMAMGGKVNTKGMAMGGKVQGFRNGGAVMVKTNQKPHMS